MALLGGKDEGSQSILRRMIHMHGNTRTYTITAGREPWNRLIAWVVRVLLLVLFFSSSTSPSARRVRFEKPLLLARRFLFFRAFREKAWARPFQVCQLSLLRAGQLQITQYLDATLWRFNWALKYQLKSLHSLLIKFRHTQVTRLGQFFTNVWNDPRWFEIMAGLPPRRGGAAQERQFFLAFSFLRTWKAYLCWLALLRQYKQTCIFLLAKFADYWMKPFTKTHPVAASLRTINPTQHSSFSNECGQDGCQKRKRSALFRW